MRDLVGFVFGGLEGGIGVLVVGAVGSWFGFVGGGLWWVRVVGSCEWI